MGNKTCEQVSIRSLKFKHQKPTPPTIIRATRFFSSFVLLVPPSFTQEWVNLWLIPNPQRCIENITVLEYQASILIYHQPIK